MKKDLKVVDKKNDLLRHPEHLCSLKVSSCGAEERAKLNVDPSSGKEQTDKAEDICTPLFTGV
jgi:hypothetical protein